MSSQESNVKITDSNNDIFQKVVFHCEVLQFIPAAQCDYPNKAYPPSDNKGLIFG